MVMQARTEWNSWGIDSWPRQRISSLLLGCIYLGCNPQLPASLILCTALNNSLLNIIPLWFSQFIHKFNSKSHNFDPMYLVFTVLNISDFVLLLWPTQMVFAHAIFLTKEYLLIIGLTLLTIIGTFEVNAMRLSLVILFHRVFFFVFFWAFIAIKSVNIEMKIILQQD